MPSGEAALQPIDRPPPRAARFQCVQILRFAAAAAVLAFHAHGIIASRLPDPGTLAPLRYGYLGVDLFFVISGFIIQQTVATRERDWRLFARRRAARIVPLYWLCTLAMAALLPVFSRGGTPALGDLVRSLLFVQWSSAPGASPIVYLGWSLEYELLFYALATAALALTARPWGIVLPLLAALVALGAVTGGEQGGAALHFLTNPMLLEFAFGVLAGETLAQRRVPWRALVPVALAALMAAPSARGQQALLVGLPAAALVFAAAWRDRTTPLPRALAPLVRLGDASYSLYLSQVFTVSLLVRAAVALPGLRFELSVAAIVLAGLAAGWLMFVAVERPIDRALRRLPALRGAIRGES